MIAAEVVRRYPDITILQHIGDDGMMWWTHRRWIFRGTPDGDRERMARFPPAYPRDIFGFSRATARAMRADKANVYVNQAGVALAIRGSTVYRLARDGLLPLFHIQGDSVLHGSICEDVTGWSYFGEYFMNPDRGSVRVWRISPDMTTWEVAYAFQSNSIRHVHGVYRDPYDEQGMWVTTGDAEGECYFYYTKDRFKHVEKIGDGGQIWRAVRLFFTPEHICWLTDSQIEANYACRFNRRTGALEVGDEMDAPFWYGSMTGDGLYVAFSTVEPGESVRRSTAGVLVSEDAFHWKEVLHFEKDAWRPMKLFKYGVIGCPSGSMPQSAFFISGEGLRGLDGQSARLSFTRGEGA
jgi:hypothetical protein